jgi:hypothetical protein
MIDASIVHPSYVGAVREFFDEQYRRHARYWWKGDNRPVPAEHATAPVFPDHEHGIVEGFYSGEQLLQLAYVREKLERSHPGFAHHRHSFINQIVRLRNRAQR